MTGGKSVKEAMNDAAGEWTKIIRKKGEKKMHGSDQRPALGIPDDY